MGRQRYLLLAVDNWQALYLDGRKIVTDMHSIDLKDTIKAIAEYGKGDFRSVWMEDDEAEEFDWYADPLPPELHDALWERGR